ncbi:chorismate--pyruvate lyase family protein [Gluconobacter morbifer]|uniref:Chorismate lyase n=1 Tax=Gluconobacter morbifer G707 TaxID=1088869 RepID=G6XF61_9PROT|nr:hypothetical protein [Gluconobacter morbifer]EHH68819.1 hypothetical protein GMO_01260 [Gluconobacter morbifer G707]
MACLGGCAGPGEDVSLDGAAVRALKARLDSQPSATAALQEGCPIPIRVMHLPALIQPSLEILTLLDVQDTARIRTRHVRLLCGTTPLSDAWNWYVPERLTAEMNRLLDTTDTPFGRAVRETRFRRQRLDTRLPGNGPGIILENRALLRRASDDAPIALVREDYLPAALKPCQDAGDQFRC